MTGRTSERGLLFRSLVCVVEAVVFAAWGLGVLAPQSCLAQIEQDVTARKSQPRTYDSEFNPSHQRPLSAELGQLSLYLKSAEDCPTCPAKRSFLFEVHQKGRAATSQFSIANETAQIDEIHIVNPSKALILGRMQWAVSVANVVDLRSGKLSDSFWCMRPSVSDDNRLVAYVKVFPLHFVPAVSYEYLVYDLTAAPEENRTPPNKGRTSDTYDVGWPVYPEGLLNTPGDNVLKDESLVHSMSSEGFFWLDKTRTFAFADRWRGVQRLVVASVASGINHPRVTVKPLVKLGIVDVEKCKGTSESAFQVSQITILKERPEYLRLSLRSTDPSCIRRPTLDVELEKGLKQERSSSLLTTVKGSQ